MIRTVAELNAEADQRRRHRLPDGVQPSYAIGGNRGARQPRRHIVLSFAVADVVPDGLGVQVGGKLAAVYPVCGGKRRDVAPVGGDDLTAVNCPKCLVWLERFATR